MKSVLDESVPRDLAKLLVSRGCDAKAFPNAWKGTKNGSLLRLIKEAGFDCLITCDKNLHYQQNVANSGVAVVLLPELRLERLAAGLANIVQALSTARLGETVSVNLSPSLRDSE